MTTLPVTGLPATGLPATDLPATSLPATALPALDNLPETVELSFNNETIALTHGHQFCDVATRHQKLRKRFPQASIIVYGHSHRLVCDRAQEPWVINPGAGGYNLTFGGASCLLMQYQNQAWSIEEIRTE